MFLARIRWNARKVCNFSTKRAVRDQKLRKFIFFLGGTIQQSNTWLCSFAGMTRRKESLCEKPKSHFIIWRASAARAQCGAERTSKKGRHKHQTNICCERAHRVCTSSAQATKAHMTSANVQSQLSMQWCKLTRLRSHRPSAVCIEFKNYNQTEPYVPGGCVLHSVGRSSLSANYGTQWLFSTFGSRIYCIPRATTVGSICCSPRLITLHCFFIITFSYLFEHKIFHKNIKLPVCFSKIISARKRSQKG